MVLIRYVDLNMFMQLLFWAGNQGNYQISTHPCYQETLTDFDGDETFFFLKLQNEFINSAKSQYFFSKISGIGPLVSRIDWCKGHWCSSTYVAVRLISSKTGKKCIFCVFRLFLSLCRTASRPYRLNHINVLHINQSY